MSDETTNPFVRPGEAGDAGPPGSDAGRVDVPREPQGDPAGDPPPSPPGVSPDPRHVPGPQPGQ
jgi:hypothetical protein